MDPQVEPRSYYVLDLVASENNCSRVNQKYTKDCFFLSNFLVDITIKLFLLETTSNINIIYKYASFGTMLLTCCCL